MVHVIILAGGKGTRMKSDIPKALIDIGGIPMIKRVARAVTPIDSRPTIVIGRDGEKIVQALGHDYHYVWQKEQRGTGNAVLETQAELHKPNISEIVVLYADHPLISETTIRNLIAAHRSNPKTVITMVTVRLPNFSGDWESFERFGRIRRDAEGQVRGIVEWKDATPEEREIREVNPGYYCFDARWLWENIGKITDQNAAHEYYLTDLVGIAVENGKRVEAIVVKKPEEGIGVNTREERAIAEKYAI